MKDFQQRVIDEKKDLDEKMWKLHLFIQSSEVAKVDQDEFRRLTTQHSIMMEYSRVLGERIAHAQFMSDNVPRRARVEMWTPAEKAIHDAVHSVEAMPASVHLTNAVILLQQAKDKVADFVDGKPVKDDLPPAPPRAPRAPEAEF
jgi:hypothetical protein